jgi:hypothetical protein
MRNSIDEESNPAIEQHGLHASDLRRPEGSSGWSPTELEAIVARPFERYPQEEGHGDEACQAEL